MDRVVFLLGALQRYRVKHPHERIGDFTTYDMPALPNAARRKGMR